MDLHFGSRIRNLKQAFRYRNPNCQNRLCKVVECLIRRSFEAKSLAQILRVYSPIHLSALQHGNPREER
jgi:hypothetical protein